MFSADTSYLQLVKKQSDGGGLFDDGLAFLFKDEDMNPKSIMPHHIHIEIMTGTLDLETCDVRLYSVEKSDETQEEMDYAESCTPGEFG